MRTAPITHRRRQYKILVDIDYGILRLAARIYLGHPLRRNKRRHASSVPTVNPLLKRQLRGQLLKPLDACILPRARSIELLL